MDQKRWQAAFLAELDRVSLETAGRVLQSVFFGGGTPSLMDPDLVAAILSKVRSRWPVSNDPEVTLEANPTSVEAGRFAAYRQAGVNRVSIGVQSLEDEALRQLGRMHSAKEALKAIEIAQAIFPRVSFDLIYARQGQTLADWGRELKQALAMSPKHLSLYQLTVEEGTVFHERSRRGLLTGLPDEDLSADLFLLTREHCASAGLSAYEVSNYAVEGEEARHNLTYWRGGDYLGVGPGAHGRLTLDGRRIATEALRQPGQWLQSVESAGHGELPRLGLTKEQVGSEFCMMGLRMREGISLTRFLEILGRELPPGSVSLLIDGGFLHDDPLRLRATESGMLLLNAVLRQLLSDCESLSDLD